MGTSLRGKWVPRVRDPLDNALAIAAALCSDDPATSQIMAPSLGDVLYMLTRYCCRAILGGARMMLFPADGLSSFAFALLLSRHLASHALLLPSYCRSDF